MRQSRPDFSVSQTHRFRLEPALEFRRFPLSRFGGVAAAGRGGQRQRHHRAAMGARLTCHETKQMIRLLSRSARGPTVDRGG